MSIRIGVDLGGTKIEGIALDGGRELGRLRTQTPNGDYVQTVEAIVRLVTALEAHAGARGSVGLGIPGAIERETGLVKNANSTWLIGRPLGRDLEHRLERPVRLANDANCFAMSEAADGAAAGADVVFGAILGTGTGGGIVVDGRILTGVNGVAGEWGHNPLPWPAADEWPGPACYCGKSGCIETFLSGPGMARDYGRTTGATADAPEIVRRAEAGERDAVAALDRYEDRLARALAAVINVLDPDVIVLGGGLSNITRLYDRVPTRLADLVFGATQPRNGRWTPTDAAESHSGGGSGSSGSAPRPPVRTRLVRAQHGDSSGVRGAAWLWGP